MLDVAVLGAGVSGLTLAWLLRETDLTVRIFEARSRVGGRTWSPTIDAHRFDLGASWVWDNESAVHDLIRSLGVGTYPSRDEEGDDLAEDIRGPIQRGRLPRAWSPARRIRGGTFALTETLASALASEQLQLGRVATRIEATEAGLRVTFNDGNSVEAKQVVATYPPPLVADHVPALDDQTSAVLRRTPIWMGDIAKVIMVFDNAFWRARGLSGRVISRRGPIMEMHDLSGVSDAEGVALFGFVPKVMPVGGRTVDTVPMDVLETAVRGQLTRVFGADAEPKHVEILAWWTERFTVPDNLPQPDERLFGHARLREPLLEGRLHLASTETAPENPGLIDGAVRRASDLATHFQSMITS